MQTIKGMDNIVGLDEVQADCEGLEAKKATLHTELEGLKKVIMANSVHLIERDCWLFLRLDIICYCAWAAYNIIVRWILKRIVL